MGAALASDHRDYKGTDDELNPEGSIYGCVQTQSVAIEDNALYVADNYAWFCTEAFWSQQCGKTFRNPGSADDKDPLSGTSPGMEAHAV